MSKPSTGTATGSHTPVVISALLFAETDAINLVAQRIRPSDHQNRTTGNIDSICNKIDHCNHTHKRNGLFISNPPRSGTSNRITRLAILSQTTIFCFTGPEEILLYSHIANLTTRGAKFPFSEPYAFRL
ncbi:hypothetical protein IFM58399_04612 [Aspergillus lentulus]|uniref:Uncharacterized protein n=1 Tax=Aspergillus lentulus TaxID=293939 RepID=A0ABQ0ZU94_ASPLE|nr:uncharacterized protein IFM58399_04612 [Aspergillus lentulus]GFF36607.1 hypothetical protein IFM58399_04612 [Aspergillus lentulus]GFF64368.1 hypothetical protein IFM60648_01247 [Aspergillus lentulus]GFF71539.1 hypothetical protein IFM62136_08110 [Aspergillus lentulus]GFF77744.1 hypothetical protein IFM47457_04482 [Aspergillus lentulus]GFF98901.1 hypothetical protein IFM61392_00535 [Aspergillus lentulus]